MAIQYQIIYWRDIPTHLRLRQGRARLSFALPEIFQKTVYRAAYRGKAITGEAYEKEWHSQGWYALEEGQQRLVTPEGKASGDKKQLLAQAAAALADDLIAAYDEERLNTLALNEGYDPAS